MVHRCQLQRDPRAGYDETPDYVDNGSPVMCKLWANMGREAVGPETTVAVEDLRAIVPLATDVNILDVIREVKDRSGSLIDTRQLQIQTILTHRDHLELVLQVLST